jgi:hypothetical protein
LIVTLGDKGCIHVNSQGSNNYRACKVKAADTTAAGDSFIGTLAAASQYPQHEDLGLQCTDHDNVCSKERYLYKELKFDNSPWIVSVKNWKGIAIMPQKIVPPENNLVAIWCGKNTTKMLVNVFYNLGTEGTKQEYGYRGTPVLIDLGFDAAKDFHKYEIEWCEKHIRWFVDEHLVYERIQ